MSVNLTICPECGSELDTVSSHKDLPLQVLQQECNCGYEVKIAIVNYPDSTYEVVGPALNGDTCGAKITKSGFGVKRCGDDAMVRVDRVGKPLTGRCREHMRSHRSQAMGLRSEL